MAVALTAVARAAVVRTEAVALTVEVVRAVVVAHTAAVEVREVAEAVAVVADKQCSSMFMGLEIVN